jgi:hypothetical protein
MRLHARSFRSLVALPLAALVACGGEVEETITDDLPGAGETNPMLAIENEGEKEDTAYVNPNGREVEVDMEADVSISGSGDVRNAPAELGQFALTYLRKRGDFFLESLAENAGSADRVEWLVAGSWKTAAQARSLPASQLTRFRIRGVNAVVLGSAATGMRTGKKYTATVPKNPYGLFTAISDKCAEAEGHIRASNDVYWYVWQPTKSTCATALSGARRDLQEMQITVTKLLPKGNTVYPEYDKLVADKKITAVILFGQIGDGRLTDSDQGVYGFNQAQGILRGAGYREVTPAPVGKRFSKTFSGIEMQVDLYSPYDFSGLGDYAKFPNFQRAISEHEIVAYDGHSMLGASDFWARPRYPSNYQIFLYGGCLGYQYYVKPVVDGKGGWANLDMMSSVIEVTANANMYALPAIAKITSAIGRGYRVSWQEILSTVRTSVGDSTFGASGIRDNKFKP